MLDYVSAANKREAEAAAVAQFDLDDESPDWLKRKSPAAPAVKREAEEDWGKQGWR
jgi:hypothetical protein